MCRAPRTARGPVRGTVRCDAVCLLSVMLAFEFEASSRAGKDKISTPRPAVIFRLSGHTLWVSSESLTLVLSGTPLHSPQRSAHGNSPRLSASDRES